MTDESQRIEEYHKRLDRETESFATQLSLEVEKRINKIVRDLEDFDGSIESRLSLETIRRIEDLEEIFRSRGYAKLLDDLQIGYASELREARELLQLRTEREVRYTAFEKRAFEVAINLDIEDITSTIRSNIGSAKSILYSGLVSGSDITEEFSSDFSSKLKSRVETELRTSRARFQQSVTNAKAEDLGLQYFEYVGPIDKVTRPFCLQVLTKNPPVYKRNEIDALDNGQTTSAFQDRGGYNCRHRWLPISDERAKELGRDDA